MILWYVFSLLAALLSAFAAIVSKKTLFKEHATEFSVTLALFNAIITAPILFTIDYASIPLIGYVSVFIISMFAGAAFILVQKAVRHSPVSLSSPMLAIAPMVTAIFAFVFLGESLTFLQIVGLILVIVGVILLSHKHGTNLKKDFYELIKSKTLHLILMALVLYAVCRTFERYIYGPIEIGGLGLVVWEIIAIAHVLIFLFMAIYISIFYDGWKGIKHGIISSWKPVLLIALLTVGYRISQSYAVTFVGGKVAMVSVIKKTSALMVTIVGGTLFHEKNLLQRSIACVIVIVGILLML